MEPAAGSSPYKSQSMQAQVPSNPNDHHSTHTRSLVGSLMVGLYGLIFLGVDLFVLIAGSGHRYELIVDIIVTLAIFGVLLFRAFPRWFYIIFAILIFIRGVSLFAGGLFVVIELREWIAIATIIQGCLGMFIGLTYCFQPGSGLGKLQIFQPYRAPNPALTTQV